MQPPDSKQVSVHSYQASATSATTETPPSCWNIRQKVPLGWFPLSGKPFHLLHPGNGKAASRSPSAASESCCSAWPLGIVLIPPIHAENHVQDAPVIQGRKFITRLSQKCQDNFIHNTKLEVLLGSRKMLIN